MTPLSNVADELTVVVGGRYALVRRLAVGGMAEVWLARQQGLEGFEKLVVVKRILPHLATDPEFVQMFLDEARTAADLRHTNVASVTDVGTEAGAYFIAMEYLHGQDLTHVVQRCSARGERIPLQHALQIVSDAAQGLEYAHRKTDRHGTAQQIVHRDVSPQNLLVTYEGTTKLLDFGIASAAHRTTHTAAGIVKGKYAYMSPEQFDGTAIDGRSDLFSLGIVLWELVTMQRLFWKPSDAETLRAVMECKVPLPSAVWPECPPALEALILRMLSIKPDRRLGSCAALVEALDVLLEGCGFPHSQVRVGGWMRSIFPEHRRDPAEPPPPVASLPGEVTRNEKVVPLVGSQTLRATPRPRPAPSPVVVRSAGRPFFGRRPELEQLALHLAAGVGLVTICGGAGQGKSRLAARFVESRDRHWTVELGSARGLDEVARSILIGCGLEVDEISETSAQLVAQAGRRLATLGAGLVVLDNFELASPAARDAVSQWRLAAPQLSLLVTRREALGLGGEAVVTLEGLEAEAVRMFVSQIDGTGMSPTELEQVDTLCTLLKGTPMAIELVASHAARLQLSTVVEFFAGRPAGDAPLASAIAWSCTQLGDAERRALGQLSVFRGGFTLDAAAAVLERHGDEELASLAASLVRLGLLNAYTASETPGRVRFRVPKTVADSLPAEPEAQVRHARWFVQLGEKAVAHLQSPAVGERLAVLLVERHNLFEVLERAPGTEAALQALHGLAPLLSQLGPSDWQTTLLEQAIAAAGDATLPVTARALQQLANAHRRGGRSRQALEGMTEALARARLSGDRGLEVQIGCDLAQTCFAFGDVDGAITGLAKALELARQLGDSRLELIALSLQAAVFVARRELSNALAACDKALPLARDSGDALSEARVLGTVGSLFLEERRTELARAFFSDAVAKCEQAEELPLKGFLLGKLAQVLAERNEPEGARLKVTEALRVLKQVGDLRHLGLFLSVSASLRAHDRQMHAARADLAAAAALLEKANDPQLLAAHALTTMEVGLLAGDVTAEEARALIGEVRASTPDARARVAQSEEVRLAVLQLERALGNVCLTPAFGRQ